MRKIFSLVTCMMILLLLSSCAQEPDNPSTGSGEGGDGQINQFITFTLTINEAGKISPNGYYVILFNNAVEPIEVTNTGTYTDGIRLYIDPITGPTHYWFHRIPSVPGPGYEVTLIARVDEYAQISADWRSVSYTFNTTDSSVIFNQYIFNNFTAHAMTTDCYANAVLGRVLDTMGLGPDISQNPEYTVTVSKQAGPQVPLPPEFPMDSLYDWTIKDNLPSDFHYINFDIESFQIKVH